MRGLNPRQIEAFRAVVLTGGVSAAASLINVTQPAVSRMIRDLQQDLGLVLFERRGTGLVPTSEALSLYAEVERAFMPPAPFVAVLPERHRLARKKKLRPRDFEGENFISLGPSTLSRFRIDRMFAEHGITRILRIETPLSEIACALAGAHPRVVPCQAPTATEHPPRRDRGPPST